MQKFMPEEEGGKAPELSKRRNIIVIADEAHRSQYDLIDGLARNLRDSLSNASFIGLTPSLPSSVGLRPALCAVYVSRRPPFSIHRRADSRRPTPIRARSSAICLPRLNESAAHIFDCAIARVVISIYDIQRAVADKATVPIYYESRVAKRGLTDYVLRLLRLAFTHCRRGIVFNVMSKHEANWQLHLQHSSRYWGR